MRKYSCQRHQSPSKATCPQCHTPMPIGPLSQQEELAQRLAVFLSVNDVDTYTSEKGYRLKKVTIRPCYAHGVKPWGAQIKEDAA